MYISKPKTSQIRNIAIDPGSIVLFIDKKFSRKPDQSGFNQVGILLPNQKVLCLRGKQIAYVGLGNLGKEAAVRCFAEKQDADVCCRFFVTNQSNWRLVKLGLNAIPQDRFHILTKPTLLPPIGDDLEENYDCLWNEFIKNIRVGDALLVRDTNSLISKIIAKVTSAPWSHVAICLGNGKLSEATLSGVIISDINSYKKKHYRLGLYRAWKANELDPKTVELTAKLFVGKKYNYKGVLRLGLATILGIKLDKNKPKNISPNDIVYGGDVYLVSYL